MMLGSVRSRVTLIAFVSTLIAVATTAYVLAATLERSLLDEVDATITNRAIDVAEGIVLNNELNNAAFPTDPETFIGVVENAFGAVPIMDVHNDDDPDPREVADLAPGNGRSEFDEPFDAAIQSLTFTEGADNLRVVFTDVAVGDELVIVARSLDGIDRTMASVWTFSAVATPLLSALVGGLVWLLVGRALRPVEQMRREVESIRAQDLSRRVDGEQAPTEVAELAKTMNSMLDRLDGAQTRQRRFAADAAHELRSPLASMAAQLDVDAAHPDTANTERTASRLRTELTRLQRLVEDLMLLSRSEGSDVSNHRLVDLDDIIDTAIASIDPAGVHIGRPSVTGAQVRGEPRQLERLFTNLMSNGVRHAVHRIEIALEVVDQTVVVAIDDDGSGIAAADRDRIFERFVRLDEARNRDDGGSGLGLALAQEITLQHGGSLVCDASPLGGARFAVRLPAA